MQHSMQTQSKRNVGCSCAVTDQQIVPEVVRMRTIARRTRCMHKANAAHSKCHVQCNLATQHSQQHTAHNVTCMNASIWNDMHLLYTQHHATIAACNITQQIPHANAVYAAWLQPSAG
jgi:hypothetical protein